MKFRHFDPYKADREAKVARDAKEQADATRERIDKVMSGAAHAAKVRMRAAQTRRQKTHKPTLPTLACLTKPEP